MSASSLALISIASWAAAGAVAGVVAGIGDFSCVEFEGAVDI